MSLRIAIFDDNRNIRDSISMLLNTEKEFKVVGSYANVLNNLRDVEACNPDVILMDIECRVSKQCAVLKAATQKSKS